MEHLTPNGISVMNGNSDIETAIEEERSEQEAHPKPRTRPKFKQFLSLNATAPNNSARNVTKDDDRYLNTM